MSNHAHFLLDGRPLCENSCMAYRERFLAVFGSPFGLCDAPQTEQLGRFAALDAEFPGGRVALMAGPCPFARTGEEP